LSYREISPATTKNGLTQRFVYLLIAITALAAKSADIALGILSIPVTLSYDFKLRYIDANPPLNTFAVQWEIIQSSTSLSKWSEFTIKQLDCFGLDLLFAEVHASIFDPSIPSFPKLLIGAPVIIVYKTAKMILCFCIAPLFSCTSQKSPILSTREVVELSHDLGVSLIASSLLQVCTWSKKLASDKLTYPVFTADNGIYIESIPDEYWGRQDVSPPYMTRGHRNYPQHNDEEFERGIKELETQGYQILKQPTTFKENLNLSREVYL
jgi:hypothetical protein